MHFLPEMLEKGHIFLKLWLEFQLHSMETLYYSGVEEEGARGAEPPSCDLIGAQPPQLCKFFWNLEHI